MFEHQQNIWLESLQKQGYRITNPLKIIVEIMASSDVILNPTQVFLLAKEKNSNIGLVTIYRSMEKLEQAGLIGRVHMPDGCQSFFHASNGHQHLIICEQCGKAEYFEGDDLNPLFNRTGEQFGYQITDHWLQLFGFCQKCKEINLNRK